MATRVILSAKGKEPAWCVYFCEQCNTYNLSKIAIKGKALGMLSSRQYAQLLNPKETMSRRMKEIMPEVVAEYIENVNIHHDYSELNGERYVGICKKCNQRQRWNESRRIRAFMITSVFITLYSALVSLMFFASYIRDKNIVKDTEALKGGIFFVVVALVFGFIHFFRTKHKKRLWSKLSTQLDKRYLPKIIRQNVTLEWCANSKDERVRMFPAGLVVELQKYNMVFDELKNRQDLIQ